MIEGKTGQQIEDDVFSLFEKSTLLSLINGKVYLFGMRPKNSGNEDAVVKFVTGLDGQIQTGVVVINIYVPNIEFNGVMVRNIERCAEIEKSANQWVKSLIPNEYLFSLAQTIYTEEDPDIEQHFISIRLKYRLKTI